MKHILVPTDFSQIANHALAFAKEVAIKLNAEITLLHVLEVPYGSFSVMGEVVSNYTYEHLYETQLIKRSESRLEEIANDLKKDGVSTKTKLVYGNPFVTIRETIAEQKTDLVIIGSKGASGLTEILIGSNAERVIRHSTCPVIVVKGETSLKDFKSIALATDSSAEQDSIIPTIKEFQNLFDLNLHLVRVCTPHNFLSEKLAKEEEEIFAKRNGLKNYTIGVIQADFTDEGVLDFATKNKASMIAIGTHARKGLAHFFGGSIAEDIANHSHIPILTVKIKTS